MIIPYDNLLSILLLVSTAGMIVVAARVFMRVKKDSVPVIFPSPVVSLPTKSPTKQKKQSVHSIDSVVIRSHRQSKRVNKSRQK